MTTIVYRDGVLAGDTRITIEEEIQPGHCRKVFKLKDGSLFASSGDYEGGERLLEAIKKKLPTPICKSGGEAFGLHIKPNGAVWYYEGTRWSRCHNPFYSIGSGRAYAFGALHMGATAAEAVSVAMKCDMYSGGRVQTVRIGK